jgi:hypothetical protein
MRASLEFQAKSVMQKYTSRNKLKSYQFNLDQPRKLCIMRASPKINTNILALLFNNMND